MTTTDLPQHAREVRRLALTTVHRASAGHAAADMSAADILTTLYWDFLEVDPERPADPERDRFVCSKSHASAALYSVLSTRGFLPEQELDSFGQPGSRLCLAVSCRLPGVEMSTGALGHGLPFAVGAALGARLAGSSRRTVVLTGDGELQEGSNWEAVMFAATRGLDNLILVVDRNRVQKGASTEEINALEPLEEKFRAFGWAVRDVDGHDTAALSESLAAAPFAPGRPSCLLAETVKGKGVSFMENDLSWHSGRMSEEQFQQALGELEA
ncbi:MAG: transketolase [Solirubrobacterales bacterium]